MDKLDKKISGDFFDLKQHLESSLDLKNFLKLTDRDLELCIIMLRQTVEKGIVEYKTGIITKIFRLIDSLRYDMSGLNKLKSIILETTLLLYVTLLQFMISKKVIKIKEDEPEAGTEKEEKNIMRINSEINDMIEKDKELKNNKFIQNIISNFNLYKKELDNMKKMLPNIPAYRRSVFKEKFTEIFSSLSGYICDNYAEFKKEIRREYKGMIYHSLSNYDISVCSEIYKMQAENISKIKSTLEFAVQEKYKIMDILSVIKKSENSMIGQIKEEDDKYYLFSLSHSEAVLVNKMFSHEIEKIIRRQIDSEA